MWAGLQSNNAEAPGALSQNSCEIRWLARNVLWLAQKNRQLTCNLSFESAPANLTFWTSFEILPELLSNSVQFSRYCTSKTEALHLGSRPERREFKRLHPTSRVWEMPSDSVDKAWPVCRTVWPTLSNLCRGAPTGLWVAGLWECQRCLWYELNHKNS